jgi:hypothetical protein
LNFEIKGGKVHRLILFPGIRFKAYEYTICGLHFIKVRVPVNKRTRKPVTCGNCKRIMEGKKHG